MKKHQLALLACVTILGFVPVSEAASSGGSSSPVLAWSCASLAPYGVGIRRSFCVANSPGGLLVQLEFTTAVNGTAILHSDCPDFSKAINYNLSTLAQLPSQQGTTAVIGGAWIYNIAEVSYSDSIGATGVMTEFGKSPMQASVGSFDNVSGSCF